VLVPAAVNGHDAIECAPGRLLGNADAEVMAAGEDDYSAPRTDFYVVVPSESSNGGPLGTFELDSANHTYWQAPHLRAVSGTQYVYSSKGLIQGTIDVSETPFADYLGQLVIVDFTVMNDGKLRVRINGVVQTISTDNPGDMGTSEDYTGYAIGGFLDLSLLAQGFTGFVCARICYRGSLVDDAPAGETQTYNYLEGRFGPLGPV
jgi:hypothetical protein